MATELYLWTEQTTFSVANYPGGSPQSKVATVVKYQTNNHNLAGVTFQVTLNSGSFPDVANNANNQTFQSSTFAHFGGSAAPTGVPETADIYGTSGNIWALCSGNSQTGIITLAGDVGLESSTNGTNVLAYLYDGHFTIDSISSATDSDANSYATQGWNFQVGEPGGGGTPVTNPSASGVFSAVTVTQGQTVQSNENLEAIFSDVTSFSYNTAASGKVSVTTSGTTLTGKFTISAAADAAAGQHTLTVTGTNTAGDTDATRTITVTVVAANQAPQSAGDFENVTVGKSPKGGTLYVENFKSKFSDPDGDTLTYTITSSATSVCTATENGDNIDLVFPDGMNIGQSTITVTAVDATGSNTSISKTFTVSINEPKNVYVWSESELQDSTMTTVIKMHIVDTNTSIPGVHLKYNLSDASNYPNKPQIDSDYQQSSNNPWNRDSAMYTKGWNHQMINTTTVGKEYIVLFDSVSKKLVPGLYDLMYFSDVKFDIEIIGLSDQHGNIISYSDVLNQAPPTLFEDTTVDKVTGKKYGDVNVDDLVNADDVEMLSRYLVRNNTQYNEPVSTESVQAITKMETEIAAFTATGTYVSLGADAGGVEGSTGKAFSHIDVDRDGKISVADLCRLAEAIESATYNIIG